jgi:hypothetical protein
MKWSPPTPALALPAVALLLAASPALADPSKSECANANTEGQMLRMSEKFAAARARLQACQSASCPAMVRSDCTTHLDELERAQPTIVFEVKDASGADASDVTVTMDGAALTDRLEGGLLRVDPGSHTFKFTVQGRPSVTLHLVINEGEKARHEHVVLGESAGATSASEGGAGTPQPSEAATRAATATSAPESSGSTQRFIGLITGIEGLAAIVAGAVFGGLSLSYANRQKNDCQSASSCSNWSQAVSDHDSALTDGTISTVALVAGGVLLAGGALLYFTAPGSSKTPEQQSRWIFAPSAGPGGGGVVVRGGF